MNSMADSNPITDPASAPVDVPTEEVANTTATPVKKSAQVIESSEHAETDKSEDEEDDEYNIDQDESECCANYKGLIYSLFANISRPT